MGSPSVTPGAVTLQPTGVSSAQSMGTPITTTGPVTVLGQGFTDSHSVGTPTVRSTITVLQQGFTDPHAMGAPSVQSEGTIALSGIPSLESLGSPAIATGPVTVAPVGIASAEAVGQVSPGAVVPVDGIAGESALSVVTIAQQYFYVSPPTREVYEWGKEGLLRHYLQTEGVTWYKVSGQWNQSNYLPDDLVADEVYRGGREYEVDAAKAAELQALGFSVRTENR